MHRVVGSNNVVYQWLNTGSISPLSISSIVTNANKYHFSTNENSKSKSKKSKIKFVDDYDDKTTDADETKIEDIEEATIEQETKKTFGENARQTISNVKFSEDDEENKHYQSKLSKYLAVNIGLDNILPRMLALKDKDPEAITKTMNAFWMANVMYVNCSEIS